MYMMLQGVPKRLARRIYRRPKVNLGVGVDVGVVNTGGIERPGMIGWLGMADGSTDGFGGWRSSAEAISRPKRRYATRNSYCRNLKFRKRMAKKGKFRKFACQKKELGNAPHENAYHTVIAQKYSGTDLRQEEWRLVVSVSRVGRMDPLQQKLGVWYFRQGTHSISVPWESKR